MNDFALIERNRALARAMEHLQAALGHLRAAQSEDISFDLNLVNLAQIDRSLLHTIHCVAHVYQQPPETPA